MSINDLLGTDSHKPQIDKDYHQQWENYGIYDLYCVDDESTHIKITPNNQTTSVKVDKFTRALAVQKCNPIPIPFDFDELVNLYS